MTPSAVSQQLTNLAGQLGVQLLEAQGRRVRLTDAAHLVLRHAEAVFAQLERADAELTGYLRGEAGQVRVGAFSTAVPALVVPAVRLLGAEGRPGPQVRVREAEAAQAFELLSAGEVDLALSLAAHAPTARDPRFTLLPLLADPLDVALPAGHRLAGAPALRLADLSQEPWIFGGSGPWSEITTAACEAAGFVPEQAHSAAGFDGDPRHGAGVHGCRAGPPDGLRLRPAAPRRGHAGPGGGPALSPCGGGRTAGRRRRPRGRPGAERAPAGGGRFRSAYR